MISLTGLSEIAVDLKKPFRLDGIIALMTRCSCGCERSNGELACRIADYYLKKAED
jgi:hypothetical protein